MKIWGKFTATALLIAAQTTYADVITSPAFKTSSKKSNILSIGGRSEPFGSLANQYSTADKKTTLSTAWSSMKKDFKNDYENESFFTVINKVDPKTKSMALSKYFGLDTSLTSMSKKGNELSVENNHEDALHRNYSLVIGNKKIAMHWDKNEKRFIPSAAFSSKINSMIELVQDGKKIIQTSLPLQKLNSLTLDLSKPGYTTDKITIESKSQERPNCSIIAGWETPDAYQTVMFELHFHNNELDFSNFERDKLSKIKEINFNEKVGTTLLCSKVEEKSDDKPYNTFVVSAIPVNLKIIESEIAMQAEKQKTVDGNNLIMKPIDMGRFKGAKKQ